ncbi:Guanylate kinase [Candidatus Phytoplasma pruni]|uniref:Guanylate kinase n=2 Tax=Candidatus Phytoplasma pruni TaxID=479893 RepID=A0A0M1N010_9MOLU|nr:Guanylate kinase [Candidatus Phytoplasma pruni]MCQ9618654.1 Guanylate kinase [Candidatus Phytoplasma pruni]
MANMRLHKKGLVIVISGPSGVGKGTLTKALLKKEGHNFVYSSSMTTRAPRKGEIEGKDYFFVDQAFFQQKIKEKYFLEHNKFIGNYYGTPYEKVLDQVEEGKEVILEIDVQGSLQIRKHKISKDAIFIFIVPPTKQTLYNRLKKRNTESEEIIRQRMDKADQEFLLAYKYDYIVVNDDIDKAVDKIISIIIAEHSKVKNSISFYLTEILNKKG